MRRLAASRSRWGASERASRSPTTSSRWRLIEKHDRQSDEGRALRSLRELRVRAAPAWSAATVELTFLFVRERDAADFEGAPWHTLLEAWLGRVRAAGRFVAVDGIVQTLDDLSARDYVESDPLDLGFLSERAE